MEGQRITAVFLAVWALVAVPCLCAAGLIGHDCDCADSAGCHHEADCSNDPCPTVTASRGQEELDGPVLLAVVQSCPAAANAVACSPAPLFPLDSPGRFCPINLPYALSDIPLLI